ncbi:uncharacterized protein BKA78DRAFT_306300 [Phyllosticta capitalensis]|uniref:uncharacterized protein n=1 Tax=Phyllosticta capitalensis TaxID=121624 RepID=UPI00312FE840
MRLVPAMVGFGLFLVADTHDSFLVEIFSHVKERSRGKGAEQAWPNAEHGCKQSHPRASATALPSLEGRWFISTTPCQAWFSPIPAESSSSSLTAFASSENARRAGTRS